MSTIMSCDGWIRCIGYLFFQWVLGLQQDWSRALDLWIRATELGFTESHYNLGMFYYYNHKEVVENWLMI